VIPNEPSVFGDQVFCGTSQVAEGECFTLCVEVGNAVAAVPWPAMCADNRSMNCGTAFWNPDGEVGFSSGRYQLDFDFIESIIASELLPLFTCDDAAFELSAGGEFYVANASPGELLYELGLRNGDRPQNLNGMPLGSYQHAFAAYRDLWLEGEKLYSLVVIRNNQRMVLRYQVNA